MSLCLFPLPFTCRVWQKVSGSEASRLHCHYTQKNASKTLPQRFQAKAERDGVLFGTFIDASPDPNLDAGFANNRAGVKEQIEVDRLRHIRLCGTGRDLAFVLAADQAGFLPVIGQLGHGSDKVPVVVGVGCCLGDQVVDGGAAAKRLVGQAAVAVADYDRR